MRKNSETRRRWPLLRTVAILTLVGIPASLPARTNPESPGPSSETAAVCATVERYLRGLKFNDVESLATAFRPEAKLFFVQKDGSMGELTQEKWYEGFRASAGKEEEGTLAIASVDVTGDAASVKVVEEYARSRYVDYLSLLKIQGSWWIVNKIYTVQKK